MAINNQEGMSLVEVMMSIAIAAIITSGLLTCVVVQTNSNNKITSAIDKVNQQNITTVKVRNILSHATTIDFQPNFITITTNKAIYGNTTHALRIDNGQLYINNLKAMSANSLSGSKSGALVLINIDSISINQAVNY